MIPATMNACGEDDLGPGGADALEQPADVLRGVGQVEVDDDDVVSTAQAEPGAQRLPEAEVDRVPVDPNVLPGGGESQRQVSRPIGTAVVHDDQLEAIEVPERLHVVADAP